MTMTAIRAHRLSDPDKYYTLLWEPNNIPRPLVVLDWFKRMFGYGKWEVVEKSTQMKSDRRKTF